MFQANVYKIMIGAPSDIKDEVEIAIKVIYDWNNINAEKQRTVLLPLHWSISTYPITGIHPQKAINQQVVNKSDLLICIFGVKLGTPTESSESGSVEEIEEHLKAGKPVMLFFKNIVNINDIDIEQISRLKKFKEKIGQRALYAEYTDIGDFKQILEKRLYLFINEKFIDNKIVYNESGVNDNISHVELSDFDKERLKSWTSTDNPDFRQVNYIGGGGTYWLGASNKYEVKTGREKIEWDSFFEKLLNLEFIDIKRYDKYDNPIYQLKEAAYKYVENHNL